MNATDLHETNSEVVQTMPVVQEPNAPPHHHPFAEGFLRFVVVVAGIILGAILVVFVGLTMNWIQVC